MDATFKYILFALCLALTESVYSLWGVHKRRESKGEVDGMEMDQQTKVSATQDWYLQKARSERNMYLASFAITACMAIVRLVRLAAVEVQLRDKIKYYNGDKAITETGDIIDEKKD